MTLVVDASIVVAALTDDDALGQWARRTMASTELAAPSLLPVEVLNSLRRLRHRAQVDHDAAVDAVARLAQLRVELHRPDPLLGRVWDLRDNLSAYDAWYVALAEALDAPLATLDRRLATSPGPRCAWLLPDNDGIR